MDLKLYCSYSDNDTATFSYSFDHENLLIEVEEDNNSSSILLSKQDTITLYEELTKVMEKINARNYRM